MIHTKSSNVCLKRLGIQGRLSTGKKYVNRIYYIIKLKEINYDTFTQIFIERQQ